MRTKIEGNLAHVRARIAAAAERSGRDPESVKLVAVTKGVGAEEIQALVDLGVADFGENRIEATRAKKQVVTAPVRWHMIGSVQRRKARDVVELFDCVHSIDRLELAETLERQAASQGRALEAFVEVNVSGEASKHGFAPGELTAALQGMRPLEHVRIVGLMTMAPFVDDPEEVRPVFARLREIAGEVGLQELSMGMSNDYEVAIEEGATVVRVGTALFV